MYNLHETVLCMESYVLVKEIFTNRLNMGLLLRVWIKKIVHRVETHWLPGKEKVLGVAVSKETHADSLSKIFTISS